jgi:signal transduction histidine kinase
MLLGTRVQQIAALAVALAIMVLCRFRHQHYRLVRAQIDLKADKRRLHGELERERQKETELLRIKAMLLESAGHDLIQPVHGMGLLIQKLRLSPSAATLNDVASELQHGLDSFNRSLTTILDTVRLDSGAYIPETFDLPIQSILDRVVAENSSKANGKGLVLKCRKSSAWVRTDPVLAYSIISNFVYNAIRYTHRGRILVATRRRGQHIVVEIWDSGIGIPQAAMPELFRDFYQVQRSRSAGGMGMGLALVLRMAKLLGSPVAVRSAVGKGSRFSLQLLAARPQAPTNGWIEPQESMQQKTVVVVDSNSKRLERTHNLLTSWGFVARSIRMTEAALQPSPAVQEPVDVLIASLSAKTARSDAGVVEALCHLYRPAHSLLVLDESSDIDAVVALRAAGVNIFHQPMPPWRLRMILGRLLRKR